MAVTEPSLVQARDATAWDAADGAVTKNFLDSGTSTGVTDTTLTDSGKSWTTDEWTGAIVTSGGKTLTVTSNTGTVLTGTAGWSGGGNPGTGAYDVDFGMSDDVTGTGIDKQGKSPNDIHRVEFKVDPTGLSTSDTISIWIQGLHNYVTGALLPYSSASGVTTTDKITYTAATGENKLTLTQNFIDDLFDQGGGSFAVRVVEDQQINGDANIAEYDADLTVGGGGITIALVGYHQMASENFNKVMV